MSKEIKHGKEARTFVMNGIDKVADIVKTTVGPVGRNVLVRNQISQPIITNDGVTIAKSIELKDTTEDAGAQLIISAANKTNLVAGDGTTSTTILAQKMLHNYFEKAQEVKHNPVAVQKQMVKAANDISEYLKSIAQPIVDTQGIEKVATVSSGSVETGKLIATAFEQAGEFGSVIVEDSKTGYDNVASIQGMKLSNGSVTRYILNDIINNKSEIYDMSVLVIKDKIDSVADLFKVLSVCVEANKKLLIICDDIEYDPLNMVMNNKNKGVLSNIGIIRLPGFGELRENLVEDICLATGATLLGRDLGLPLHDFTLDMLGEIEQAVITMDDTVIKFKDMSSTGVDLLSARKIRCAEIDATMKNIPEMQQEQYKRRKSNLIGGISVIQVGGNSDVEIKDKKLRIEDALNSVQAAKEEGIVAGGGYSFISAYINAMEHEKSMNMGEIIVYDSLLSVTSQIAENSGVDGSEVVQNCINKKLGYNALTNQYENLIESGVINSVKVDRLSLINAASVASVVITMGGSIVEENEKDPNVIQLQGPMPTMM